MYGKKKMMDGGMPRTKKAGGGMYNDMKKRNAMNAGGMVAAAMEVQKAN
jgi:hypothetical protein